MDLGSIFSGSGGFGNLSPIEVEELRKAISTGYDVTGTGQAGGAAMRMESLDNTLAVLSEQAHQIVWYSDLNAQSQPATSTAIEIARNVDLGAEEGGWYQEGELPDEVDATYDRIVQLVKFAGTVKNVTLPATLTRNIVDQIQEATTRGSMWLLRLMEKGLLMGNAKLGLSGAEYVEPDGLETYISRDATANHIIDLEGNPLEEEHLRNGSQVIIGYNGFPTHIYMPTPVLEDYAMSYLRYLKVEQTDIPEGGMKVGFAIKQLQSVLGTYNIRPLYLYAGLTRELYKTGSVTSRAPTPAATATVTAGGTTGTWEKAFRMTATGQSGTAEYMFSLVNRFGESLPVVTTPTSITTTYGNRALRNQVVITNPATGYLNAPTHARIYRRDTDRYGTVSAWGCVHRISLTSVAGGGTLTWDDTGENMAGTYRAWMGELRPEILQLRHLLPFTRIPLPMIALSQRFALVMFSALTLHNPYRWVEFRNVGRRSY